MACPRKERSLLTFNGKVPHSTQPFEGERYSLVFYVHTGVMKMDSREREEAKTLGFQLPPNGRVLNKWVRAFVEAAGDKQYIVWRTKRRRQENVQMTSANEEDEISPHSFYLVADECQQKDERLSELEALFERERSNLQRGVALHW